MSQRDFFSIWAREAEAALAVKKAGLIIDMWKCVGARRVVVVVNVDGLDTLDQILLDLPIIKELGQHVHVEMTPLRRFEDLATDVKVLLLLLGGTTWMSDAFWAPDGLYSRLVSPLIRVLWLLVVSRVLLTRSPAMRGAW